MDHRSTAHKEIPHDERRSTPRKNLRLRATLTPPGRTVQSQTIDLSAGGVCVALPFALSNGDECGVRIDLSACGSDTHLELRCRVCYCVQIGDKFRIGLQFIEMTTYAASFLRAVLR
jgi:c-di-GMP-binding flagellar brake protein YcgR